MLHIPKKWRELPLKKRLELPVKYFKLDAERIENIRKIKNKKVKLIESGKIQFEKFGEIHSFLIAWIAGYGSDVVVRQVFGSTKKLRELFIQSPAKVKGIEFSWKDIKRGIKLPKKMNEDLAEETGIHIGDGCLFIYTDKGGTKSYQYSVCGDLKDEELYHLSHIVPLMKRIYNIEPSFQKRKIKNSIETRYRSKAITLFKNRVLGLVIGNKKHIKIPPVIMNNNNFSKRCLVGIFDTDFNITKFLAISGKIYSLNVAKQMHNILERNKIKHIYRIYNDYARFYIPKDYAIKIVKDWRMSNLKHTSKFEVFEKFNRFIPFTTMFERLSLLNEEISLKELESISIVRKNDKEIRSRQDSNL